jgi:trigger factor
VKVTKEKTENSQAFLTIEVEPGEVETGMQKAYQRVVKKANVPGFRKGKAPRELLERYIGKEALLEEALEDIVPDAYEKALKEQTLEPFAQPKIEVSQMEPVIFKAVVPLPPTVTPGDYKSIKVEPIASDFKDEDVDKVIEQLRHQNAVWEPVERPINTGDMVTMDIKSDVQGKPVINRDGWQYQLEPNTNFPLPGFAAQLVGLNQGEEKEFKLQMPVDYSNTELAGKDVAFRVKIGEIKQEKLPEINDEFAKIASPECQDVAALRERIATELKTRAEERARLDYEEKVIQAAVDISKVEYPPVMLESEIERLFNQQLQYLQMSGVNIESYLKALKKSPDDIRAEMKPRAEKRVLQSLVLEKIAEVEKTEVTDAEIDTEIETLLKSSNEKEQAEMRVSLNTPSSRESIKDMLLLRKAAQQLINIAKSSYTEIKE